MHFYSPPATTHTHTHPSGIQTNLVFGRRVTVSPHMPESETETQCGKLNCCIHHLALRLQSCSPSGTLPAECRKHTVLHVCSPKKKKFRVIRSALLAEQSTQPLLTLIAFFCLQKSIDHNGDVRASPGCRRVSRAYQLEARGCSPGFHL